MVDHLKFVFASITTITEEEWLVLKPMLKIKKFKKNDYYLSSGEIEQQIGFITKGSFKWFYINQKGEEVNFHFFFDQNFVVEYQSFLTQNPSQMFIQAMEDTEVILLPKRKKILEFYAKSHNWERLGRIISESVYAETANRVQDFLFRTAEERYINLLNQHPDIFQRVSLTNISSYLGIQGPSLSRIRKRLSKQ
ncbi:MAG: Crp/Fnr family transcriptional regulator [Bacteroidetes bacterium]|nr:Crp/Fnr family transcriptional regulator [Bacteroidota bacterium]